MPTYNSDMVHCCQHQCKKREDCYRYWLGQHKGIASMYYPAEIVTEGCEFFIKLKD